MSVCSSLATRLSAASYAARSALAVPVFIAGCLGDGSEPPVPFDASDAGADGGETAQPDASEPTDAGQTDAGDPLDAGPDTETDGGPSDAGPSDAGPSDAGRADAGLPVDAGPDDADAGFFEPPARALCSSGKWTLPAVNAGALADPDLVETSGLAASFLNADLLWAHNDSGDTARIFAVGTDGADLGRVTLSTYAAVDVEDIALAPCPEQDDACVWVADTGDNLLAREEVALLVFPEPLVSSGGISPATVDAPRVLRFTYETGPVDVEALAVTSDGQVVYLFEKKDADTVRAFALRAPFDFDAPMVATVEASFTPPGLAVVAHARDITAADLHVSGETLLLRVYGGIYEFRFGAGQSVAHLGDLEPALVTVGPLSEPQGEALTYDAEGTGIFSVSEDPDAQAGRMLHHFLCSP